MHRIELKAQLAVTDAGEIEGIAWPFGSPDMVGDRIEKGAFSSPAKLPMLFAHDQAQAVGVWEGIAEDADGLKVKGRLLVDDVSRAREVRALVREGAVTGLSIGFVTMKSAPRRGGGRTITALELREVSIVAVPAHPGARVTVIKENKGMSKTEERNELDRDDPPDTTALEERITSVEGAIAELKGSADETTKTLTRIETKMNRPGTNEADEDAPKLERKAFTSYLKSGVEKVPADEVKALVVSNDSSGGYLAPADFTTEVIKGIVEISPIRQAARVGSTASGEVLLPKRTGRPTANWTGETEESSETGSTYGQIEIPTHEMACYVDVSVKLLEDAAVNVEAEVAFDLAEEFGRLEAVAFLKGDGAKKPRGVMQYDDVPLTKTGNASTLGAAPADTLIDAFYALAPSYRGRAVWLMNGKTLAAIRKLKDTGTGTYLWQPALTAGQPATILGRPVLEDPEMPDIGAAAEPIVFGDFSRAYRIYDRVQLSILRDPYSAAKSGLVRFHARRRVGGGLVLAEALRKIKCATA